MHPGQPWKKPNQRKSPLAPYSPVKLFACKNRVRGFSLTPYPSQRCGDAEIVFGAFTADDLRPEPGNVHQVGAAVEKISSYGV